MKKLTTLALALTVALATGNLVAVAETPLAGKIIALDAGHGGEECGAQYPANSGCEAATIVEKDVNLAVVYALKDKLESASAYVVLTRVGDETMDSRKSRVDLAIEKCYAQYLRKCDILVSVHHNGNTEPSHDGTLVIYNEKKDIPLARALHDALMVLGLPDEGYLHGGYGMTVYGNLVSALTEAYYITNTEEAAYYLEGSPFVAGGRTVLVGARIQQEADAQILGLSNYFASQTSGGGGGKGGKPK